MLDNSRMIKAAELLTFNFERVAELKSNPVNDPNRYIRSIASFVIKLLEKKNMEILLNPGYNTITWTTKTTDTFSSI